MSCNKLKEATEVTIDYIDANKMNYETGKNIAKFTKFTALKISRYTV